MKSRAHGLAGIAVVLFTRFHGANAMMPTSMPYHMHVDHHSIYWTNYFGRTVHRQDLKDNTGPREIYRFGQDDEERPEFVAGNDTHVFVSTSGTRQQNFTNGRILALSSDGRHTHELVSGQNGIASLVRDGAYLYWTTQSTVARVPTEGGAAEILVSDENYPRGLAVDDKAIYWASGKKSIRKLPFEKKVPITLAADQDDPFDIQLDHDSIYWTNQRSGLRIMRVSKSGGSVLELVRTSSSPIGLAIARGHLFWSQANGSSAEIHRLRLADSSQEVVSTIAFQEHSPLLSQLAATGDRLYWIELEKERFNSQDVNTQGRKAGKESEDLALRDPVVFEPEGNRHLIGLEVADGGLDIIHFTASSRQFDRSRVPWAVLEQRSVKYGIPEHYRVQGTGLLGFHYLDSNDASTSANLQVPPFEREGWKRTFEDNGVQPTFKARFGRPPIVSIRGSGNSVLLGWKDRIVSVEPPATLTREWKLPPGHQLVDLARRNDILFIATSSKQGYRDGELQRPFATVQIFTLQVPSVQRPK